jgi:hypothetical protein
LRIGKLKPNRNASGIKTVAKIIPQAIQNIKQTIIQAIA